MARPSSSPTASTGSNDSLTSSTHCGASAPLHGTGARKVHYRPDADWDLVLSTDRERVDADLLLPHFRAHRQPRAHRLSMFVHSRHGAVTAKVCRQSRAPFLLSVHAPGGQPVTLYLPSDFAGTLRLPVRPAKLALSTGFANAIEPRVRFANGPRVDGHSDAEEDEVEVYAAGVVTLRMWDVCAGAPESVAREAWRKLCRAAGGRERRGSHDWDFLLDD